jgi:hypothetical protein
VWPITLSGRLPIADLVGRYPANYLMGRELTLYRISPLTPAPCGTVVLCGISTCFQVLSPCRGQIAHALLTRPPLEQPPKRLSPLDLHVLGTPPAFVLSQNQTLMFNSIARIFAKISKLSLSLKTDCFCLFPELSFCSLLYRFQGSFAAFVCPREHLVCSVWAVRDSSFIIPLPAGFVNTFFLSFLDFFELFSEKSAFYGCW